MARADVLKVLYAKTMSPMEFNFEKLIAPAMHNYLTPWDIQQMNDVATSIQYNANMKLKKDTIDKIMTYRGFKRFHSGTNRVVYRHLEDPRIVAKIAIDRVGLSDNPNEFKNQFLLKPFVTKVFEVSPCGTVGLVEKVEPITSRAEFLSIANDVFDVLVFGLLGLYALDDVGTDFFMNWGVRVGFGPVLLDYPYVFELDGNKLHCNLPELDPITGLRTGRVCDGEIDYDEGFNFLVCPKCGKKYCARDLALAKQDQQIILKGGKEDMSLKVSVRRGDEIICGNSQQRETTQIVRPKNKVVYSTESSPKKGRLKVHVSGGTVMKRNNGDNKPKEPVDKVSEPKLEYKKENNTTPTNKPKFNKNFKATFNTDVNVRDAAFIRPTYDDKKPERFGEVDTDPPSSDLPRSQWMDMVTSLDIPEFELGNPEDYDTLTEEEAYSTFGGEDLCAAIGSVLKEIKSDFETHIIRVDQNDEDASNTSSDKFDKSKYNYSPYTVCSFINRTNGDIYIRVIDKETSQEYKFKNNLFKLFPDVDYFAEDEEDTDDEDEDIEEDEIDEDAPAPEPTPIFDENDGVVKTSSLESVFPKIITDFKRMCADVADVTPNGTSTHICYRDPKDDHIYSIYQSAENPDLIISKYKHPTFEELFDRLCKERGIEYIPSIKEKLKDSITNEDLADEYRILFAGDDSSSEEQDNKEESKGTYRKYDANNTEGF